MEERSLFEILTAYSGSGALPMHMPGHKRNAGRFPWLTGCGLDVTEIDGMDDLNDPEGIFRDLADRIARVWGAKRSFPLVNGSTVGVLAAVLSAADRSGTALVARGCHKSVYHGVELAGCGVRYLLPDTDPETGAWLSVTPESVERALSNRRDVRLVAVTSPTYEGVISDIRGIAAVCRKHGALLLVDEAHGAHLGFGGFPESAVQCGADLVVQSLHKTLPSPTQTAVLHVGERADGDNAARRIAMLQSSSPSYLLSSGLDGCVRFMEREGDVASRKWRELLRRFDTLEDQLKTLRIHFRKEQPGVFTYDPSKLVLSAHGVTGPELMERFRREHRVELEMAAGGYAVAMTGLGDTEETLSRFESAVLALDRSLPKGMERVPQAPPHLPVQLLRPGEAAGRSREPVPLKETVGRISAEYLWAYPPGAPLLVPGERVDEAVLESVRGLEESGVRVRSSSHGLPEHILCLTLLGK